MSSYIIKFHRYTPAESRISNPVFKSFESFADALDHAQGMIAGMEAADPASRFTIASIENHSLRGIDCSGGGLFETAEELTARVENSK